jgi:hypothetical protein
MTIMDPRGPSPPRPGTGTLEIAKQVWALHDVRIGFSNVDTPSADWSILADADGPPRPEGASFVLFAGHASPGPRSAADLPASTLVFTVEDSGDILPFTLDAVDISISPVPDTELLVGRVTEGTVELRFEGFFEASTDAGEGDDRHTVPAVLEVCARIDGFRSAMHSLPPEAPPVSSSAPRSWWRRFFGGGGG